MHIVFIHKNLVSCSASFSHVPFVTMLARTVCAIWMEMLLFYARKRATSLLLSSTFMSELVFFYSIRFSFAFCARRNRNWLDKRIIQMNECWMLKAWWIWQWKNEWMQRSHRRFFEINYCAFFLCALSETRKQNAIFEVGKSRSECHVSV